MAGAGATDEKAPASTRERILDVALDLFTEQGYDGTSLRQIAERMGFSKAALYYHFASKDEILLGLHLRLHEFGGATLRRLDEAPATMAAWSTLFQGVVEDMMTQRQLLLLHQRNHAAIEKALHGLHQHDDAHEDMEERLRRTLADRDRPVRDRVRLASAIGAVYGAMAQSGEALSDIDPGELAEAVREVMRDILRPGPAPRTSPSEG